MSSGDIRQAVSGDESPLATIPPGFYAIPIFHNEKLLTFELYERGKTGNDFWRSLRHLDTKLAWRVKQEEWADYQRQRTEINNAARLVTTRAAAAYREARTKYPTGLSPEEYLKHHRESPERLELERLQKEDLERKHAEHLERIHYVLDHMDECRQDYGKLTGFCGICGRALTDPRSVAWGIGPECAKKVSRYGRHNRSQP
jgi:hypothetical protein